MPCQADPTAAMERGSAARFTKREAEASRFVTAIPGPRPMASRSISQEIVAAGEGAVAGEAIAMPGY